MAMKAQDAPGHEHNWGADLLKMKAAGNLSSHGHVVE